MPIDRITNRRVAISPGDRFSRLTIINESDPVQMYTKSGAKDGSRRMFLCGCDCGNQIRTSLSHLRSGHTESCGCLRVEMHPKTHGFSHLPEYEIWIGIKKRCGVDPDYLSISIHPSWESDFVAFYSHVGPRPTPRHSIDRINNIGNYEPGNLRWATLQQQARNKRNNAWVEFRGERRLRREVAEELGLRPEILKGRALLGITGDALFKPLGPNSRRAKTGEP